MSVLGVSALLIGSSQNIKTPRFYSQCEVVKRLFQIEPGTIFFSKLVTVILDTQYSAVIHNDLKARSVTNRSISLYRLGGECNFLNLLSL